MSHQLQGERAGLINADFDTKFLDNLTADPVSLTKITHTEFMREAGSEGISNSSCGLTMRGALSDDVKEVYRYYHVPASNTGAGLIIFEDQAK